MRYDTQFISEKEGTDFNPNTAMKGSTLAAKTDGEEQGTNVFTSVENFQRVEADKYSATVDGTTHYFNSAGQCIDDASVGSLVFVESNIEKDITNTATSGNSEGDENKKATISSLNPRDYFAQEIMNGFMRNIDKPFNMSDADIYKYSLLSYKVAQSMINVAAYNRATDPESSEIEVDAKTLNGNTEKLLNNIVANLAAINTTIGSGSEGGGGSSFDGNLIGWPSTGSININLNNIGMDAAHPLHVTSGFPSRSDMEGAAIPNPLNPTSTFALVTFNEAGVAKYTYLTSLIDFLKDNTKSGLGTSLAASVLAALTEAAVYNKIKATVEDTIESMINKFAGALGRANPGITIPTDWNDAAST